MFMIVYFLAKANPTPSNPPKTSSAPPAIAASFLNSLLISFSICSYNDITVNRKAALIDYLFQYQSA